MVKKETHTTENTKLYELGFHIVPTVTEDQVAEVFSVIKDIISKNNGEIVKEAEPKAMKLAYTIITKIAGKNERFNSANFAWIKFTAASEDIESIKQEVEANEQIIRFIVVKTVDDEEHSTSKLVEDEAEESEESIEEVDDSKESESESDSNEDSAQADEDETEDSDDNQDDSSEKTEEFTEDEIDQVIDELVEEDK
jgi:ribosomal protein S6